MEKTETPDDKSKETTLSDQNKIKKIMDKLEDIKSGRQANERQWLVNIAFLFGKHYFNVEKKGGSGLDERIYWELKNMERKKKTLRVSNYILPLYRSLLSRMLRMKSTVTVEPTTSSDRDKAAAKVGGEAIEDFWQNANKRNPFLCVKTVGMMLILKILFQNILAIGTGYLKPVFNPKTKSKAFLNDEIIEGEIGEVEAHVVSAFNLYMDPLRRYCIERTIRDVDEIEDLYGVKIKAQADIAEEDVQKRITALMEGNGQIKIENSATVFEYWQIPNKEYPKGRLFIFTDKEIILDVDLPEEYKGRLAYHEFEYLDILLSPYAQGMIEQLISLQEEYNFTITRLASYKKWMAGKVMIPRRAKISTKWDDEVGQMIFYESGHGVPTYQNPPSPPAFLMEDLVRIRKDMEDIAGAHDAAMGRLPQDVKSGVAIENLNELDNSQMAPNLMTLEQKLAFFTEMVLDIMQYRYTEKRFVELTGDLYGAEVKSFKGSDLNTNRRIRVTLGSSLPTSKDTRQKYILDLEARGFINKQKARELLEFGDVEGIYHSVDESLAKMENQALVKGGQNVKAEQWEDHAVHAGVHTNFMKTSDFFKLSDPLKEAFKAHLVEHQNFLRAEMQAASAGQGGAPAPAGGPQA